jgi:hypothetical protein
MDLSATALLKKTRVSYKIGWKLLGDTSSMVFSFKELGMNKINVNFYIKKSIQ